MMGLTRVLRSALLWLLALCPAAFAAAQTFSNERIDQLTAQVALYPDALLSQVLMASTYPADVAAAAKWSREHPDAKGDEAVQQVEGFDWDPSVASLLAYPQVIVTMGEKPDWVKDLGDAFLEQPEDVMDSVQRLRAQAQKAGNLRSNEQMKVSTQGAPPPDPQVTVVQQQAAPQQIIVIEPAQPQVVYVPSYNPVTVYGPWMYPAYPPIYVPPPPGYWWSVTVGSAIAWGIGNAIGNAMWGGCDWGRRDVHINVNRYNNINRRIDVNTTRTRWSHDTKHRGAVPYRGGEVTRQQLDRKAQSVKRDNYRGRAEATMRGKGIEVDRAASRDYSKVAARDVSRDRAQAATRDAGRDVPKPATRDTSRERPAPATRDVGRDRPQPGQAKAGYDRAEIAQAAKQRDQVQKRDRDQARAELSRASRDNAFKGAGNPNATRQIDRGVKSQQSMQQRPAARPQTRPQARPQPKPMARPQARPQPKPMARPQGRAQPKAMR